MQIELEPVYILHTRPYRDTSLIANCFSLRYGRISCVVRGVRKSKSAKRNLLNPFHRLLISFQGKTDLKLLTHFESDQHFFLLEEKYLFSGFYLNEILMRLLPEQDAHESLFVSYENCLQELSQKKLIEPCLRRFELDLLRDLGYAVSFEEDADSNQSLESEVYYSLDVNQGFIRSDSLSIERQSNVEKKLSNQFIGADILAIARSDFSNQSTLLAAKKITRLLLSPHLGNKPLMSRELFSSL